ncbi:MAG: type II secretion system F family protein [Candidatus Solibacter usitatus]|nr:type II secretion system F family protein [Candidatus Solibacter usitatus]
MTSYHFRAVSGDGKLRTGTLAAGDEKRVAQELRRQGLIPLYVGQTPQGRGEIKLPQIRFGRRRDVLFFTQELSTLLNAGVPLDRALSITSELSERAEFRALVSDILRTLKGGKSLADSLATKPDYFPEIYVNMVRAGEASGSLSPIFDRLSEYEKTRDELRGYIISSMVYPSLLTVVGFSSIFVLLYFVVPRFAQAFSASNMRVPAITQALLDVSSFVRAYGLWGLLGLAAALAAFRVYTRTAGGRYWWDGFRLKLPLLGDALRKSQTAQFTRAMGTLIANGVPLVQGLGISRGIMTNRRMSDSLELVSQGVKRGEGLSQPLAATGMFPPLVAHLLAIGEETGRLDSMFLRAAEIYDNDTKAAIKRFTALFEPLIILIMGVAVGALILSMLLAISGINEMAM